MRRLLARRAIQIARHDPTRGSDEKRPDWRDIAIRDTRGKSGFDDRGRSDAGTGLQKTGKRPSKVGTHCLAGSAGLLAAFPRRDPREGRSPETPER